MLSKINLVEEKLKQIALLNQKEENDRDYDWISKQDDVNFWKFLSINYLELDRFFTLLDVETGPNSGWEKFVEALGLILWEDRKWCHNCGYHNGAGPTRVALSKILEKEYNESLSLGSVLELLKEMGRFDILLQVNWQSLIEKYRNLGSSYVSIKTKEEPLIFQLNLATQKNQLVNSECLDYTNGSSIENFSSHNESFTKNSDVKVKKKKNSDIYILMTYASETEDYAHKIANELRENKSKGKRLKFVMLGDPAVKRRLAMDFVNTLHMWLQQVRYVVPVLSPQYLRQVQNLDNFEDDRDLASFNRFIYKFILDQYVSFGSRNLRCRPVCSEQFYNEVKSHPTVKGNGLFAIIWNCSNEKRLNEFALVLKDKPILD